MNGIEKCEMFRAIRKRLCEDNNIPFLEEKCPTPNEQCIGTCQKCDYWLEKINKQLEMKRKKGYLIYYEGAEGIYKSNLEKFTADIVNTKDGQIKEPLGTESE